MTNLFENDNIMKALFVLFFSLIMFAGHAQMVGMHISGVVTQNGYPVSSASITKKGSVEGIYTNEKGAYRISAEPGEVLVFQHLGLQTVEVLLEDVTKTLNIAMKPVEVQLEEVVVKKNIRKKAIEREIEFDTNMDLIRTNLGIFDTRKSGLSIQMINGEDLNKGAPTFLEAMRGKFIGNITYQGTIFDEDRTIVFLRTTTSLSKGQKTAIYDVDGVIMDSPPLFLTIQEIDRIAVIRGIGASGRYGARGHAGVIVINTKRGEYKNPKLTQSFKDSLIQSRKRAAAAFATSDWNAEIPAQLNDLYQCKSEEEALHVFEDKRDHFYHAPFDAIEVGNYFINVWKNKNKANEIWNSVKKKYADNAVVLKALAYMYELNSELTAAMQVYQAVASLRPTYVQSYRDLANINAKLGRNKKALNLYATQVLNREEAPQSGIDSIINIESHNLLVRNNMVGSTEVIDVEQLLGYSPIRMVMEWNNGEAEFELQGMNPPNYYSWKHTYENDPERIMDEKTRGYSSKQFYLNQELGGKWRFNLKYLGNKSFEPTYLKTTIYFDYGKPTQRKQLKVFRLQKENVNRHLLTIDLDTKAVSS